MLHRVLDLVRELLRWRRAVLDRALDRDRGRVLGRDLELRWRCALLDRVQWLPRGLRAGHIRTLLRRWCAEFDCVLDFVEHGQEVLSWAGEQQTIGLVGCRLGVMLDGGVRKAGWGVEDPCRGFGVAQRAVEHAAEAGVAWVEVRQGFRVVRVSEGRVLWRRGTGGRLQSVAWLWGDIVIEEESVFLHLLFPWLVHCGMMDSGRDRKCVSTLP